VTLLRQQWIKPSCRRGAQVLKCQGDAREFWEFFMFYFFEPKISCSIFFGWILIVPVSLIYFLGFAFEIKIDWVSFVYKKMAFFGS